jgi:hypothetical protein
MFQKKPAPQVILGIGKRNDGESMLSDPATLDDNLYRHWSHPNSAMMAIQGDRDASHSVAAFITKACAGYLRHPGKNGLSGNPLVVMMKPIQNGNST